MRVLFVRPHLFDARAADALEPLAYAVLAGLTPREVDLRLCEIADAYRARGMPVVAGGYHPTFLPEETLAHADAVVLGDAEAVWPAVVRDARAGTLQRVYKADDQPALDGVVFDRSIFAGLGYRKVAAVQVGRGCRSARDFCSIHAFYGPHARYRPAGAVADDPALLALMARSGCVAALVGFESLDGDNLRQMNKAWMLKRQGVAAAVARFHDHGIMVYGSFIFGYDADTRDTMARTIDFAIRSKLFLANISPLTPMPGSRLYQRLAHEGRLLFDRWWLDPRYGYGNFVSRRELGRKLGRHLGASAGRVASWDAVKGAS